MARGLPRPRFEVADIVRAHGAELRLQRIVTHREAKVLRHLGQCRTPSMGGHRDVCDDCGHESISYNSCRDRHCPKCQGTERAKWLERRLEHVLPIPYFHAVFTVPSALHALVLANRRQLYAALFDASAGTIQQLARDERRLGAEVGITSVLHTWGQKLLFHPHVHCVVTGGGLSPDGARWVPARERFLLPVKAMSRLFRGKVLAALQELRRAGELSLPGKLDALRDDATWAAFRDRLYGADWVVYCKPPFGGAEKVFAYLGRYTHRVAISNHRIREFRDGRVTFGYRDYADGNRQKELTVPAVEFLRRFLLHVLPRGFVRLRHYGLHASGNVGAKLVRARELLGVPSPPQVGQSCPPAAAGPAVPRSPARETVPWWETVLRRTGVDLRACPRCGTGRLVRRGLVLPAAGHVRAPPRSAS
ncbi:MAG: IS91 family transposase [Planctomycetota bacterium]